MGGLLHSNFVVSCSTLLLMLLFAADSASSAKLFIKVDLSFQTLAYTLCLKVCMRVCLIPRFV
jgi:hypothetical protein